MRKSNTPSYSFFLYFQIMLKKKQNLDVLRVIYNLPGLLKDLDYTETNIDGREFSIIQRRCTLWGWDKNYISICFSGGLNGCGRWSNYLNTISQAMKIIENTWFDAFIENIDYDVTDDIFYVTCIIKLKG